MRANHTATKYALSYAGLLLLLIAAHWPYLDLPFFWDELGQFVPAALDIQRFGAWVPRTTVPNVHPPGVMAFLAAVWSVWGYSIEVTRIAMLSLAAAALLVQYLLVAELDPRSGVGTRVYGTALLAIAPLVFSQSMMAQLDMPSMLFTALALLLFVHDRTRAAALLSIPLVLVKETGAMVPALFCAWLFFEKRRREAAWFALPFAALTLWLVCLKLITGEWFGNREFTEYNVSYPLHPFRLAVTIARRLYFLFVENFHWVGTAAAVLVWRAGSFRTRRWRVAIAMVAVHIVALSLAGGAALERYLLPVLPVLYAAFAVSFRHLPAIARRTAEAALALGLVLGNFWNPPYPFPLENNLAFTDFVRLHQQAARWVAGVERGKTIATAWPLSAALRRPDYGYVPRRLRVRTLPDFTPSGIARLERGGVDIFILYSRDVEPGWALFRTGRLAALRRRFYGYEPQVTGAAIRERFGLVLAARWERRGQWIEIYRRRPA